jgi:GntR family transcriptional regulator
MPLPDEADLLQIATRAVVIEIARVGTSAKTQAPVEVTICVIPAERVEIITPLERDRTAQWPPSRQGTTQASTHTRNDGQ